ncbi:carboxylesterase family protein [Sarocladium implicatum]|nr:carboxylesterase family protein [Sarocladium implicatum]
MAPVALAPTNRFTILDEEGLEANLLAPRRQLVIPDTAGILRELPIDHSGNVNEPFALSQLRSRRADPAQLESDGASPKAASRGSHRRPTLEPDTFEPLGSVQEEPSWLGASDAVPQQHTADFAIIKHQARPTLSDNDENAHPLAYTGTNQPLATQIEKQLAGQFEWLISYPASARSTVEHHGDSPCEPFEDGVKRDVVFGCNLLRRKAGSASPPNGSGSLTADTFTFIATPLEGDAQAILDGIHGGLPKQNNNMESRMEVPSLCTPVKSTGVVKIVEQMLSPPLTAASDRSTSLLDAQSPLESAISSPRIEDSLAEIDKLEDELEAINLYTSSRSGAASSTQLDPGQTGKFPKTPTSAKRVTISTQPATMRIKSSEKMRPSLRRSSSLTLRDKKSEPLEDIPEQKVPGSLSRSKSTTLQPSVLSKTATVKSTKPPTIPNFELPGEAVSRRLKEQREARQAQQAEVQKTLVAPKPRSQKPLTRPNFELPGEAISRRKREQHEARIRAQEEEEKKRREFKARPVRYSIGPSTLPRETITSRARQNKDAMTEHRDNAFGCTKERLPGRAVQTLPRGRNSIILPPDSESRATSASASSVGGQRSSVSAEDALQQRIRAREIFTRDNSVTQTRERAKREKETAAQLARTEAAERSRALSREWAEKKRRKELSLRKAMRESMQPDVLG